MLRPLLLALVALGVGAPVAAAAVPAPTVSVDPRYAVSGAGIAKTDFASGFASDTPNAVAVDGARIYSVGEADGNVAIVAQNTAGGYDAGFSGDGKLTFPIAADPSRDFGSAVVVLPDHSLLIVAGTDSDPASGTTNMDVALVKVSPTGDVDPSFTQIFGISASGDDTPTRAAYDPATGRIAIVGNTNATNDSWVAVRNADGSPAAFGVGGAVIFDQSPGFADQGIDVAWRPGGGLAVLDKLDHRCVDQPGQLALGAGWVHRRRAARYGLRRRVTRAERRAGADDALRPVVLGREAVGDRLDQGQRRHPGVHRADGAGRLGRADADVRHARQVLDRRPIRPPRRASISTCSEAWSRRWWSWAPRPTSRVPPSGRPRRSTASTVMWRRSASAT